MLFADALLKAITQVKDMYAAAFSKVDGDLHRMGTDSRNSVSGALQTMSSELARIRGEFGLLEGKIPIVPDFSELEARLLAVKTLSLEEIEAGLPMLGEQIRDSLELLNGNERLKIDAIKDLREELEEIKKVKTSTGNLVYVGGGSSGGGRIVKSYDISGSLNGVLKTFSLPAFWRVISIHSSSFPNAFRVTTDYTTDAAASTITFTSAITAGTTLAAGQTIIIMYSE